MVWFLIFISLTFCIFSAVVNKKIFHPVVLFNGMWSFILLLYQINLLDYYQLDEKNFWLLLFMIIGFPLGSTLAHGFKMRSVLLPKYEDCNLTLRKKIFWFSSLLTCAFLLQTDFIIIQQLANGMSYYDINAFGETVQGSTGFMVGVNIFLVYPVSYAMSPICAIEYISGNKHKNFYLLLNLVIIALYSLSHGKRGILIQFIICYIVAFLIYNKKIHIIKKTKQVVTGSVIAIIIAFFYVSVSRGINNIVNSIYMYISCTIPHMIARTSQINLTEHTYGFLSLNGFISPVIILLNKIGLIQSTPYAYNVAQNIIQNNEKYIIIGATKANAFLPPAYYLYYDWGYIGVLIGMMVYGAVLYKSYKSILYVRNKRNEALFLLLMIGIVLSFMSLYFRLYQYSLAIIYILLIYKNLCIPKKQNESGSTLE